jgi:hypothetical protein
MPIRYPEALIALIGALAGYLDANNGLARFDNLPYDLLDGICQRWHAVADKPSKMIFHGDTANFRETLVYLQIPAIRRQAGETDGRGVVNELKCRLIPKQQHFVTGFGCFRHERLAISCQLQRLPPIERGRASFSDDAHGQSGA